MHQHRINDALRFVAQRGWDSDEGFLDALARYLGQTFGVDYVVIDKLAESPGVAETVALYAKGAIVPNIRYTLADTPCDNVIDKRLCCYPDGVQGLFPKDRLLADMQVDSYAGVPLWDSAGTCIGLIAVMDSRPFADSAALCSVLQIVATTAAAELQRIRSEDILLQANAELERLAYVSAHDLQEPVRSVVSFSQMLENRLTGRLTENERELLGFIITGAKRMGTLVTDLAEYTQLISRDWRTEAVAMDEVVATSLNHLSGVIEHRAAEIIHDSLPAIPGDRKQLVALLDHLIENAIKFTSPERTPVVHIGARRAHHHWTFSVADNGRGIAPEYKEKIFDIFQRLHTASDYEGNGVGLAICKRIVERHGGRIWVDSTEGQGTIVSFTMPVVAPGRSGDGRRHRP